MAIRSIRPSLRLAALGLLFAAVPACGEETPYDWKNREVPWRYGPTKGTATPEHLAGTGTLGSGPVSKGWKCRLREGRRLIVTPFEPVESHPLFGKATLLLGLFDERGRPLGTLRSGPIRAGGGSLSLDVPEDAAKAVHEVVIWFRKV